MQHDAINEDTTMTCYAELLDAPVPIDARHRETLRYAIVPCSLGNALVALSEHGIIAIFFDSDARELRRELARRFPAASLEEGGIEPAAVTAQVVAFIESPASELELPLDIRGTAFQRSVWGVLRKIPAGTTATYADVAERIGKPKAVRAVAQACAANALAVVVPCHRVIRSDGALSGYRWGVERKRTLLDREAASK